MICVHTNSGCYCFLIFIFINKKFYYILFYLLVNILQVTFYDKKKSTRFKRIEPKFTIREKKTTQDSVPASSNKIPENTGGWRGSYIVQLDKAS